tara:strand:- start:157 stop:981 length:825 start_codon:yes stop_codon:yes gene_type:complete
MALFKTDYFIYHKDGYEPIVLEEGFYWPAFFFSFVWAFQNKLWLQGFIGLLAYILGGSIFLTEVIQFANFIGSYFNSIEIGVLIVMLIPNFIYGSIGMEVLKNKLVSDGYNLWRTRQKDSETALNEYNAIKSPKVRAKEIRPAQKVRITKHTSQATTKNTAPRKPLPSKISAQTLYIRQKREINGKLKKKLITKKTAEAQLKKAAELEEMRLIIENKGKKLDVSKEVNPKKTTSKSKSDFDYVEKLKDITALREQGAISQDEFRKLKKRIMDSL